MKALPPKHVMWWTAAATAMIELITMLFRFGFQLQSTRATASTIGVLTAGIRIHHGYIGVLLFLVALFLFCAKRAFAQRLLIVGLALLFSDLIHHFVVLWIVVGSPEFHLVYPS